MTACQEYKQGWIDAEKGVPHQPGRSEQYNQGYSDSYQLQAISEHNPTITRELIK